MKICFLVNSIFNLGGVQRVVSVLASSLVEKYDVEVVCLDDKYKENRDLYNLNEKVIVKFAPNIMKKSIHTKAFSKVIRAINNNSKLMNNMIFCGAIKEAYYPREIQKRLLKYLHENNYDIVIANEGNLSMLLAIINDNFKGKAIGWQHNSYEAYFQTPKEYVWNQDILFKNYLNRLDEYVVLTKHDKKMIEEKFNIVCSQIYNPLSFQSKIKSDVKKKRIISAGRIHNEMKGYDLLIEAFSKIAKNHEDWVVDIIGEGEDKEALQKMVFDKGLENQIKFLGFTNNMKDEYINSSIYVSASRWEGFGLTIIEAMECGVPVIAFKNTGPSEIINNNINGILIERENVDLLAKKLSELIENEELRSSLSNKAIERASDFSMYQIRCRWEQLFYNI